MAKSREMRKQLDRLERCFSLLGLPMSRSPGASDEEIDRIEEASGIRVDDDLRAMWTFSNGSGAQPWFICDPEENRELLLEVVDEKKFDAESFSVFSLYSIDDVIKWWSLFKDVDEENPNGWRTDTPNSFAAQELDKRIGPQMLRHKGRLPFGTRFMLSDEILIDNCPSAKGKRGQVVRYSHDPDMLTYVTSSFGDFFDRSLYWFETVIPRNPEKAREVFEDQRL
jgi:cell wall assembly regulator SMI1